MSEDREPLKHCYTVPESVAADVQMMATLQGVWVRFETQLTVGERQAVREWYVTWSRNRDLKRQDEGVDV